MAINTLTDLKTEIINYSKRSDLSSYLDNIVLAGEKWIFRRARTRDMEAALSVVIGTNGEAPLPADFVELKNARVSGQPVNLNIQPPNLIYSRYPVRSGGALPALIGVERQSFIFGPYPSAYTVVGTYYLRLASILSSPNALFLANQDLYLFACLAETELFMKNDPRVTTWIAMRDGIVLDVNLEAQRSAFGDGMAVETT